MFLICLKPALETDWSQKMSFLGWLESFERKGGVINRVALGQLSSSELSWKFTGPDRASETSTSPSITWKFLKLKRKEKKKKKKKEALISLVYPRK